MGKFLERFVLGSDWCVCAKCFLRVSLLAVISDHYFLMILVSSVFEEVLFDGFLGLILRGVGFDLVYEIECW